MKVISLVNQKGGVAKTTTAAALADYLARHGKKTLVVDFDPQGSLTAACGCADDADNPQALRFLELKKGDEAELIEVAKNLYLIQSDIGLENANIALAAKVGGARYLRRAINNIQKKENFDYVVLDSNPSFSQLTINVLYASDKVLVPFKPEYNSFKGIKQLFENLAEIKEMQPNLDVLGFVVTMARKTKSAQEAIVAITEFAEEQGCRVFSPAIRLAVAAADAPSYGKSLFNYNPNADVAKDYERVCDEVFAALEGN